MKHLSVYFILCWMLLSTSIGSRAEDEEDDEQEDSTPSDEQTSTLAPRSALTCYQCEAEEGSEEYKKCGVDSSGAKLCDPAGDCSTETIAGPPKKVKRACTPDCTNSATMKCCKVNNCNKNSASLLSTSLIDSGLMQLTAAMLAVLPFVLKT